VRDVSLMMMSLFFSSRRRHTRFSRDWSSDVCSSDLHAGEHMLNILMAEHGGFNHNTQSYRIVTELERRYPDFPGLNLTYETREEIGRASCRERVSLSVGGVTVQKRQYDVE